MATGGGSGVNRVAFLGELELRRSVDDWIQVGSGEVVLRFLRNQVGKGESLPMYS